ncbi:MAG: hypothetical protein AAGK13_07285, partial [Pseudomonadota bacterium]
YWLSRNLNKSLNILCLPLRVDGSLFMKFSDLQYAIIAIHKGSFFSFCGILSVKNCDTRSSIRWWLLKVNI